MKAVMIFVSLAFSLSAFGFACRSCGEPMGDGDNFCQNCGRAKYENDPERFKPKEPVYVPQPAPALPQEQSQPYSYRHRYQSYSTDGIGERLSGMGRGLVTTALSPLNVIRGISTGCHWLFSDDTASQNEQGGITLGHLGAVGGLIAGSVISVFVATGATLGTITTCADAINGTFDMVSVGYYGDWLYDSKGSGRPTPWIWERKWYTGEFPWIGRE